QNANCAKNPIFNRIICTGTYYAWMEYYPDIEHQVPNFPVTRGNVIQAQVTTVNSAGQFDPFGTYALMKLTNTSRTPAVTVSTMWALPSGATFFADSAEWVIERPKRNGSVTRLAQFNDLLMTNTQTTFTGPELSQHAIIYGEPYANS